MTVMAPCANASCAKPVALDGVPTTPAGILCVEHLALVVGADLSALDRVVRCQHAAATCPAPAIVDCTILGWYCPAHAPMKYARRAASNSADKAERKNQHFANRRRQDRLDSAVIAHGGGVDE